MALPEVLTSSDLIKVLASSDLTPEDTATINIPESEFWSQKADTFETQYKYLDGDGSPAFNDYIFDGVRYEVKEVEEWDPEYIKDFAKKGARIFITESSQWFIVHSVVSLKLAETMRPPFF